MINAAVTLGPFDQERGNESTQPNGEGDQALEQAE
jgi:hypothetical protein